MGQSLLRAAHILPSSCFFIDHNLGVESHVRQFQPCFVRLYMSLREKATVSQKTGTSNMNKRQRSELQDDYSSGKFKNVML